MSSSCTAPLSSPPATSSPPGTETAPPSILARGESGTKR
jgi:hypothetical protein